MTIGIDASRALKKIKTGTEWYSYEIIRHLVDLDRNNNYILYTNQKPDDQLNDMPKNVKWQIIPFTRGWTLIRLSAEMILKKPDVLFIPAHTLPFFSPVNSVVTVHDIGFVHNPELYPARQKIYHNFVLNYVKKRAKHIITPTEYVKQDLVKTLGVPEERITAVWHGYDSDLYKPHTEDHLSKKYSPYIFFIGRLETKKNIVNLVKAFDIFKSQNKDSKLKLILAGKPSHGYDLIKESIEKSKYKTDIIELGYLATKEVPYYLSNAEAFVFPTSLEGFGMPIIEAMACGCPVVASNNSCIPEIVQDAGILIDPTDPKSIAAGIAQITDSKLSKVYRQKGLEHSKQFSWQKSATETLKVLEKAGES
jgi:glycosyltransferase involved in cell wall biosynthesis